MIEPSPMREDEIDVLAGEYVLGVLEGAQRREVERRMADEPRLAEAVRRWERDLMPYTSLAEPVTPPPALWARIERSAGLVPDAPAVAASTAPSAEQRRGAAPARSGLAAWWDSLWVWRGLAGAGFAAALALAVALGLRVPQPVVTTRYVVVMVAPDDQKPAWLVQAADRRRVELIPLGAIEVPADKALEIWTQLPGWTAPRSLGLVPAGRPRTISLEVPPGLEAEQLFALSLEPAGGSPTGLPTGPIRYSGKVVPVM